MLMVVWNTLYIIVKKREIDYVESREDKSIIRGAGKH
jgi:hypothetical protein